MVNRQIKALVTRVNKCNTVGLDQRLLRGLLKAGLECPAFNERQKYTLCVNSEELGEIMKFDAGKWFPFDTLARMPKRDDRILMVRSLPVYSLSLSTQTHDVPFSQVLR